MLSLNDSSNASSDISNWITNGLSSTDLANLDNAGLLPLQSPNPGLWDWKGAPGFKSSDLNSLPVNQTFLMAVFEPVVGTPGSTYEAAPGTVYQATDKSSGDADVGDGGVGQNAYYNLVKFVAVQITTLDKSQDAYVQPAAMLVPSARVRSLDGRPGRHDKHFNHDVHDAEADTVNVITSRQFHGTAVAIADSTRPGPASWNWSRGIGYASGCETCTRSFGPLMWSGFGSRTHHDRGPVGAAQAFPLPTLLKSQHADRLAPCGFKQLAYFFVLSYSGVCIVDDPVHPLDLSIAQIQFTNDAGCDKRQRALKTPQFDGRRVQLCVSLWLRGELLAVPDGSDDDLRSWRDPPAETTWSLCALTPKREGSTLIIVPATTTAPKATAKSAIGFWTVSGTKCRNRTCRLIRFRLSSLMEMSRKRTSPRQNVGACCVSTLPLAAPSFSVM